MHAIWRGAVSFGLVYVPVKLYAATESHDISFRQVHAEDGGRIRYRKVCSIDGEEVPRTEISKGYEVEGGEMIVLADADLAALPITSSREISVERFVPAEQVDPLFFEKSYFLQPDPVGTKAYALLRAALKESDRVAVVTVALRQRTTMALLRVHPAATGDVIVLQTLMWPDELRDPGFSVKAEDVKESEVQMAQMLVETLAGDFDPSLFTDEYTEAVQALVQSKIEGRESLVPRPSALAAGGEVIDLMAALQKSVDAAQYAQQAETVEAAPKPSPKKRAAAKATPSKKAASKAAAPRKTAAGKSAPKKSASKKAPAKKPIPVQKSA